MQIVRRARRRAGQFAFGEFQFFLLYREEEPKTIIKAKRNRCMQWIIDDVIVSRFCCTGMAEAEKNSIYPQQPAADKSAVHFHPIEMKNPSGNFLTGF